MNVLNTHFTTKSLLQYAFPSICMMIFLSIYTIVDGVFVAQFVGETALSAINIVYPILCIYFAIAMMFATGGTAIMGKLMGEQKDDEARSFLSLLYLVATAIAIFLGIISFLFPHEIVKLLGAKEELIPYAYDYFISLSPFALGFFLQVYVQVFFVLVGKPTQGFFVCFLGGITNIVLDYVFISPNMMNLGITGAGLATGIGNSIPAVYGLVYFFCNRKGSLYFEKPIFRWKMLVQSMYNGSSELVSQLSTAITTLLFNVILFDLVGADGVAAISVILYIQMMQIGIYFGYSIGIAPIISYKFGEQNKLELDEVVKISFRFLGIVSILIISLSFIFAELATGIFIARDSSTFAMTTKGLRIFSIAYLFMGINIFMSSLFTALSNGKVSAILSLSRTFLFLVGSLLVLPKLIGIVGVWLAVPIAEGLTFFMSYYFYKKEYYHFLHILEFDT
ncbi:MAG: MATE family efflux transporter [Bacillota bacterium]